MAKTADIKNGMCLEFDGQYYYVVEFLHVKPGKGPAFVRTKLKNVMTGLTIEKTLNAGIKINDVRIERRPYQYLYHDEMGYTFMDPETYEQISVEKKLIRGVEYLKEGETCDIVVHAESDTILFVEIPMIVVLEVTYTEPGVKGDTATNSLKDSTVETGAKVRVPLFINQGDKIKVDTRDGSYVERVKE